jgi:hypothetical protein
VSVKALTARAKPAVRFDLQPLLLGLGVVIVSLASAQMLTQPREMRLAIVGLAIALAVGFSGSSPVRLLYAVTFWLTALGFLRRTLNVISPTPRADALLLVGPLAIAILFLAAARSGALRDRTRLASAVLALNVLTVIGAFNPLQGSLATGLAGLLFILVPTLAFWIGRGLCGDRTIATLLKLFAILSIPAAIYGLEQTFAGFPSWDATWIAAHHADYGAITEHGVARAFASFSAASEYSLFLAIGLVIWIAFGLTPVLAPIALGSIALLATAIFYEGSRGTVIAGFVALAMMAGIRAGIRLKWSLALAATCVIILPYAVSNIVGSGSGASYSTPFAARQAQGLQNPTDPAVSTLGAHIDLVKQGIHSARREPIGLGTGAVTIAGTKFGGAGASSEADPGNVAIAWGVPGLLVYAVIVFEVIRNGYRVAVRRRRHWIAPAALAIIVLTSLQWLNGGQYAVAFLPWLLMGWLDRNQMKHPPPLPETL